MKKFALFTLVGCFYSPAFGKTISSKSPASMYGVESTIADSTFTFGETSAETKVNSRLEKKALQQSKETSITLLHGIDDTPLHVGLNFFRFQDVTSDVTAGFSVDLRQNLSVGAELVFINPDDESKISSTAIAFGAIYHAAGFETGVGYKQDIGKDARFEKRFAGTHIKRKLNDTLSGQFEIKDTINYSNESTKRHTFDYKAKLSHRTTDYLSMKAAVGYAQPSYKNPRYMSLANIEKQVFAISADLKVAKGLVISPELEITQGQGRNRNTEFQKNKVQAELALVYIR